MDEGTTQVGSIVGKLKLDDSQWNRTLDAAEARARELGAVDPTIKVDAKVAEANAKLAATEAAIDKVNAANGRLTSGIERGSGTRGRHLRHWQVIAIAILALIPLLGPLLGWTIAVAGGMALMGAAGVAAIFGIKHAMEQGTVVGNQYRTGLQALKADLTGLADTGALSMLGHFRQAVGQISNAMPMMNSQVAFFSDKLGSTGNHLLAGVIQSLRILNPLFVTGALLVERLAAGFEGWARDGGLQQFADYAIRQIPVVSRVLGELLTMIFHIVEASAPLGTVVLQALAGIATAVNAIPIPVLTALIVVVVGTVAAFKTWGAITKIVDGVTASLSGAKFAAAGLPGVILGAALALDVLALAGAHAAASGIWSLFGRTKTVAEYSAAIRQGDIAINNLGETLFLTSGFWQDFAKHMDLAGTGARLYADEAQKLDEALSQASPTDLIEGYQQLVVEGAKVGKSTEDIANTFPLATAAYLAFTGATDTTTTATAGLTSEQERLAGQMGATSAQFVGVVNASKQTEDQLALTTLQMQYQNDAAGLLRQALDLLNGNALDVAQAQTGLAAANNSVTDSMDRNGAAILGNSEAAVANQQAFQHQAEAAQMAAAAIAENTDSTEAGVEAYRASKAALEAQLEAQGRLTPELQAYIDKLYALKDLKVPPTKLDIDTSNAQKALDAWIRANANHRIHVAVGAGGSGGITRADGGTITAPHLSDGGTATGPGTSRSDSIMTFLSDGEEVIKESSASQAGVRPFLKDLNANPARALSELAAAGRAAAGSQVNVTNNVRTLDPVAAARETTAMIVHAQKALAT